jgi:hypothetical protein
VPRPPRRRGEVVVTVDGVPHGGRAVDLRHLDRSVGTVAGAVRAAATVGPSVRPRPSVHVDCDPAAPVHAHVCRVPPASFDLRDALVAAARSRGAVPAVADRLERARADLAAATRELDPVDRAAAKRRAAAAGERERRLDERVASLRGRLAALRERDEDTAEVEAALAEAVEELTERETERIAAEQRLSQVERAARTARDRRSRRLRLEDRVGNLRREARRQLVAAVADEFVAAVAALPTDGDAGLAAVADDGTVSYDGDPATAALAVARVARRAGPVVVAVDRFGSPAEAASRLDAPVVRL